VYASGEKEGFESALGTGSGGGGLEITNSSYLLSAK
jgi:hypothetical protein